MSRRVLEEEEDSIPLLSTIRHTFQGIPSARGHRRSAAWEGISASFHAHRLCATPAAVNTSPGLSRYVPHLCVVCSSYLPRGTPKPEIYYASSSVVRSFRHLALFSP